MKPRSILDTRDDYPLGWPGTEITADDCREIPGYMPGETVFEGSWIARNKITGECFRVIGWHLITSKDLMLKDMKGEFHRADEHERIHEPGSWNKVRRIARRDCCD